MTPFLPYEWTTKGMLERVNMFVEKLVSVDCYTWTSVYIWWRFLYCIILRCLKDWQRNLTRAYNIIYLFLRGTASDHRNIRFGSYSDHKERGNNLKYTFFGLSWPMWSRDLESRHDVVVRAFACPLCGLDSIPAVDAVCGLSLLLALVSALSVFRQV